MIGLALRAAFMTSLVSAKNTATCAASGMPRAGGADTSPRLDDIMLRRLRNENEISDSPTRAGELWRDRGAIVMIVRRPGCQLCREEALDLAGLHPELKDPKPRLVAVVAETTSLDPFVEYFKGGDVYLDEERGFMKALGDRWLGLQGLFYPSVWRNGARSSKKYPELKGDLKGEGRRLGGLLVVAPDSTVLYEHREQVFGDHADLEEVKAAVAKISATK